MPAALDNHVAGDYAERIREWSRWRLQALRECLGLSKFGLGRERGVSRGSSHGQTIIIIGGTAGTMLQFTVQLFPVAGGWQAVRFGEEAAEVLFVGEAEFGGDLLERLPGVDELPDDGFVEAPVHVGVGAESQGAGESEREGVEGGAVSLCDIGDEQTGSEMLPNVAEGILEASVYLKVTADDFVQIGNGLGDPQAELRLKPETGVCGGWLSGPPCGLPFFFPGPETNRASFGPVQQQVNAGMPFAAKHEVEEFVAATALADHRRVARKPVGMAGAELEFFAVEGDTGVAAADEVDMMQSIALCAALGTPLGAYVGVVQADDLEAEAPGH